MERVQKIKNHLHSPQNDTFRNFSPSEFQCQFSKTDAVYYISYCLLLQALPFKKVTFFDLKWLLRQ